MKPEEKKEDQTTALLIAVYEKPQDQTLCQELLEELVQLVDTYGAKAAQKMACHLRKADPATFLSSGKLEEALRLAEESSIGLIVFDHEISSSQARNLEKFFSRPVIDRTELILQVFSQRAHSKEAQLQVMLAQARYQLPRLRRMWTHLHRQAGTAGAGAYLKGAGEKQIEIDKHILRKRISQLQKEIEDVKIYRDTQRSSRKRSGIPTFAIVGYTNAGKSTLLNALTNAGVFVEDKLFATLDTTTRKFTLPNNQQILLIDTVGFIRKLPHLLVAAFKSTLEEVAEADILLHIVDVNHPLAEEHARASLEVLKELGADRKPMITVLNKVDLCKNLGMVQRMRLLCPKSVPVSALEKKGFDELLGAMMDELSKQRQIVRFRIPQSEYHLVSQLKRETQILEEEYEENDVLLKVEMPSLEIEKFKNFLIQ